MTFEARETSVGLHAKTTIVSDEVRNTLAKSRRLISPLTGILRSVEEVPLNEEDAAEVSLFVSSLSDASRIDIPLSNRLHGATGETKEAAMAKAIGEAIERYCAARLDRDEIVVASYKDIPGKAIHPSQFALFSPAQYNAPKFPYPRFDESTRISWVRGYNLTREEETLVPACLTYLPHQSIEPGEAVLAPAISTGLACRGTLHEAAITAICEVVERDACMIMWLNRLSMPNVVEQGVPVARRLANGSPRQLEEVRLIDVTSDIGIPSFVSFTFSRIADRRCVMAGAASHLDPEIGALKAVTESMNAATLLGLKMSKEPDWSYKTDFSDIEDFADHGFLYCRAEMMPRLEFAYSSPLRRELGEMANLRTGRARDDLDSCVRRLASRGLETIIVDLTTEEIAEVGFHVVRAIVPGAIGLNADHRLRFLGGMRLYGAAVAMGYREQHLAEAELNPYPHPFQ